jgi:hypothetical protein
MASWRAQELYFRVLFGVFFAPDGHTTVPFCLAVTERNLFLLFFVLRKSISGLLIALVFNNVTHNLKQALC